MHDACESTIQAIIPLKCGTVLHNERHERVYVYVCVFYLLRLLSKKVTISLFVCMAF